METLVKRKADVGDISMSCWQQVFLCCKISLFVSDEISDIRRCCFWLCWALRRRRRKPDESIHQQLRQPSRTAAYHSPSQSAKPTHRKEKHWQEVTSLACWPVEHHGACRQDYNIKYTDVLQLMDVCTMLTHVPQHFSIHPAHPVG